jgi:predicted nucleic acid-binding protein
VIVIDTSAVIGVLAGQSGIPSLVDRVRSDGDLHAPDLLDVEFEHALWRLMVAGAISGDRAADARADFADLTVVR